MTIASKLILNTGTVPDSPGAGKRTLFMDSGASAPGATVVDENGTQYVLSTDTTLRNPSTNEFRLCGQSGTPIPVTYYTSNDIYLTPFNGNRIALYNGATWDTLTSSEVSLSLITSPRVPDLPFDIFAYNNSGTVTLEFLDWTNSTTRATALVRQDGVWCKTGALTRRWVGSCVARSAGIEFQWLPVYTSVRFDLFNADNRVPFAFSVPGTVFGPLEYTYTSPEAWAQDVVWNVSFMVGIQEETATIELRSTSYSATANILRGVGVGAESTTVVSGLTTNTTNTVINQYAGTEARLNPQPGIGVRVYSWLFRKPQSNTVVYVMSDAVGFGSANQLAGMYGVWTC